MSGDLMARLAARGRMLARLAAAQARERVAQRWQGLGAVDANDDGIRLSGPGVRARRRGDRSRLPDPMLLWPGEE